MTLKIVAIVPSRGLEGMLEACLHALDRALKRADQRGEWEIVLVDNASTPPIVWGDEELEVSIRRYDQHRSFSGLVNDVATDYPGVNLLLVNNDVIAHPRALVGMKELLGDPQVGVVGSRLVFPDGTIQHGGVDVDSDGPHHAQRGVVSSAVSRVTTWPVAVTGALMLIKRPAFDDVGGLDEAYDFGREDTDFCHRARIAGWAIACDHSVDSLHFESMTEGRVELDGPARKIYGDRWVGRLARSVGGRGA